MLVNVPQVIFSERVKPQSFATLKASPVFKASGVIVGQK